MYKTLTMEAPDDKPRKVERYFVQIREYLGNGEFGVGISKYLDKEDTMPIYKELASKKRYSDKYGRVINKKKIRKLEM